MRAPFPSWVDPRRVPTASRGTHPATGYPAGTSIGHVVRRLSRHSSGALLPRAALACAALLLSACATRPPATPVPFPTTPTTPTSPVPPIVAPTPPTPPAPPIAEPAQPVLEPVAWSDLPGWTEDSVEEAWTALLNSCRALRTRPDWLAVCDAAAALSAPDRDAVRAFFESRFAPHRLRASSGEDEGLVTGYYEPLLRGSRRPHKPFLHPLYGVPDDLLTIDLSAVYPELKGMRLRGRLEGRKVVPYATRTEIDTTHALAGKEIVWVDDPIEAFFLQVQGSGRVQLHTGNRATETVRLAYADQNGHPYKSIGRWLVDQGELKLEEASMQGIQAWAKAHPERLTELLNANPSFVFFREEKITDPGIGPKGALGVPLVPERSIAIDPKSVPLGAPVWLATTRPNSSTPLNRLMLAQDTGGAIRGIVRADFFWGFGAAAGEQAGRMKQAGRMWVLLPLTAPTVTPASPSTTQ